MITKKVMDDLLARGLISSRVQPAELIAEAEKLIMDELAAEDKVNDEVREILKKFAGEIEKGRLDYRKVFELTKKKIIEERGVVI